MNWIYIKRAVSWIKEISWTLLIFWVKHPKETLAILHFVSEKIVASPRFILRNTLIEKQSSSFSDSLKEVQLLYKKYGSNFKPGDLDSYRKLAAVLTSKSQLLYFLVRKLKPISVVETGVAGGESSGYILQAIEDNKHGHLYSIDLPFQWYIYGKHTLHLDSLPAGKMPGYLIPRKLKNNWTLTLGDTYEKLPQLLKDLQNIDIFLHDSEHTDKTMTFEYQQAWPYIKKGGYLLSDDVSYTKSFNDFSRKNKLWSTIFKDLGVAIK